MPTWLLIVVVVVAVLAAGAFRERWRLSGMEKWSRARGFEVLAPFVPGDRPPMAALVSCFNAHGARRWGAGVRGIVEGIEVTIGEHETTEPSRKSGLWHTLVVWPLPETCGPIVLWPRARGRIDEVLAAVTGSDSDARLPARLGISAAESATHRLTTGGGLLVEGEPRVREAWLTDARRRVLEQWPHGGAFVIDKGWAAWRMRGLLTPARLDELLQQLSEARQALD